MGLSPAPQPTEKQAVQQLRFAEKRLPSAPPISSKRLVCLRKTEQREPEAADCCTNVVHNRLSDGELRRCCESVFRAAGCCTSLVHKPSERPSPPSPRSASRSRRLPSGLIVRGRVFYLRLRVPRSLAATVGRTHVWKSLRTSNKAAAIRAARLVTADYERWFWGAETGLPDLPKPPTGSPPGGVGTSEADPSKSLDDPRHCRC